MNESLARDLLKQADVSRVDGQCYVSVHTAGHMGAGDAYRHVCPLSHLSSFPTESLEMDRLFYVLASEEYSVVSLPKDCLL